MKKNLLLLCLLYLCGSTVLAQDLKLTWSPKIKYDSKGAGDFQEFIGSNDKYVYALYENDNSKKDRSISIVSFDKLTMKKVGSTKIVSFNKSTKNRKFVKAIVNKNVLYAIYLEDQKGQEKVYAASYSPTLTKIANTKLVKSIKTSTARSSKIKKSIEATGNKEANDNLYILAEPESTVGNNTLLEYLVVNPSLEKVYDGEISLPVQVIRNSAAAIGKYSVGSDGKIYGSLRIVPDKEEKKDGQYAYSLLNVISPESGKLVSLPIKSADRNINGFAYTSDKEGFLRIIGFYADRNERKVSHGMTGVFNTILNTSTGELTNSVFTPIDEKILDQLFEDKDDKKNSTQKRKADVSLSSYYEIEKFKLSSDGSITMFCTKEYNYYRTTTTTDSRGRTTTNQIPYCNKRNVTAIKFDKEGKMNWIENIPRNVTYPGHFINDITVVESNDKFIVTYGSVYTEERKKGLYKKRKARKDTKEVIEYATFNKNTGSGSKEKLVVYTESTKKENKNSFSPSQIKAFDERFYMEGSNLKLRPGVVIASCVTAPVCIGCGIFYYHFSKGTLYKGSYQLAVIEPIK